MRSIQADQDHQKEMIDIKVGDIDQSQDLNLQEVDIKRDHQRDIIGLEIDQEKEIAEERKKDQRVDRVKI